jgi:NDP-4-keto-2,6-dideoxyhexose 3-C-methyltransferase
MFKKIKRCRICGNDELAPVIDLGEQVLTGVFPKKKDQKITAGPLELVKCKEKGGAHCGLLQLGHSYSLDEMYGENYGYRSGLNRSMVDHLNGKVRGILSFIDLLPGDLVLDIGSNDGTLLKAYPSELNLVGMDPTGIKFKKYYPEHAQLIPDFFSASSFNKNFPGKKAKVITSIAMFYDLESPIDFMRQIYEILDDDGIWVFEQSYAPLMLKMNAYDTICHEHLEYYCLSQIKWMTDKVGFKIVDAKINDVNGGSISVMAAKTGSKYNENGPVVEKLLAEERNEGLSGSRPYEAFRRRVHDHRDKLIRFVEDVRKNGGKIFGYGASTKGNVLLQFCKFTEKNIQFIAEVNSDKYGCFTPGMLIPIIPEAEAMAMKPDYFLVLPWHFKSNIVLKERDYLKRGGKLLFPLPELEVVDA